MNVVSITADEAFNEGADLWVIKNNPKEFWWPKLDFATHYLLSENFFKTTKAIPSQLINILEATKLNTNTPVNLKNYTFVMSLKGKDNEL